MAGPTVQNIGELLALGAEAVGDDFTYELDGNDEIIATSYTPEGEESDRFIIAVTVLPLQED